MFMNASMERGIDEVRNKIMQFASTTSLFGDYKVILDEADNLTADAQKALRALIEQFQSNCRFILTCNYPYKLIDPLRSRLTEYTFNFPPESAPLINAFVKRMIEILMTEKVTLSQEDIPKLMSWCVSTIPTGASASMSCSAAVSLVRSMMLCCSRCVVSISPRCSN